MRLSVYAIVLPVAAVSFLIGIQWGLPTRATDFYLFGAQTPWTGSKIIELAPKASDDRGADVDINPIQNRTQTVVLNQTDMQRAEIVRRYRLFSYQPDEMITFMSLSRIRENGGDPRLYQYGGLWIYPVGALIKVVLNPKADQAFYLDHPESFGHFYIVARVYCALFGIAGAWAVCWIIQRLSGGRTFMPLAGGFCFAVMPIVVSLSHEAKPHLPATVLMLFAVIAAAKFIDFGTAKWAAIAGALCGAAFGMIVSAMVAFSIPFVMVAFRKDDLRRKLSMLAIALTSGVIVYAITNPFVIYNAVARPDRFHSNIQNSTNMYTAGVNGLSNAISLIIEGASPLLTAMGVCGAVFLLASGVARRRVGGQCIVETSGTGDVGWLLAAPAALVAIIFVALAAHKPPEYARFALFFNVTLLIAAFASLGRVRNPTPRAIMAVVLTVLTAGSSVPYWRGFIRDSRPITSRLTAAERLKGLTDSGARTIRLNAEPAPYNTPPVDLFKTQLLLTPLAKPVSADVLISIDTAHALNPISWADIGFIIVSPLEKLRDWHPATSGVSSPP